MSQNGPRRPTGLRCRWSTSGRLSAREKGIESIGVVLQLEREQLEELGRPLELHKTSDPAGHLQGRSGCVEASCSRRKHRSGCLLSPAHLHDTKDGK